MKRKTKKQKFAVILAILLLVSSLGESVSVESMQTETDGTEETQDDKAEVKAAGATEETAASQAGTDKAEVGQAFISDENRSDSVASVSEDTNGEAEDDTESDSSNDGDGDTEEQITEVASGTCGTNVTWVLTSDGTLTIDGTGEMSDYSTYSYAKNYAPWYSYDVKYVVIDEGVTTIGSGAFYACTSLTSVSIPDTVTEIGRMAFGITAITSLTIPDSVTTIGAYAFWYSDLVSVTIPSSVEEYEYAFISCHWLESVVLSEGITKIDADAFSSCSSLTSVSIPSSVEEIGVGAFEDCVALVSITIPSGVTLIGNAAFQGCDSLESISLPESLTSIGRCAFVGCNSLKNISLPSGLTELGYRAFYASALTSITIPSGITSMGEEVFAYSYDLSDVYISEGCTILGERAFYECYSIQSITLPSSLTDYEGAFEVCSGLESVILSDGIGLVDEWAFYGCVSLTNISFPDSLTSIGEYAFSQSGLMQIDLSSGVESIGAGAFSFCDDLKSVTLSEGLVTIGKYAFKYDMALSTVRMDAQENALTVIEEGAFYYCCSLVEINLPDGLESIGAWALYGTSIEEITIPEGVSTLGDGVFYKCESLTKITFEGCAPEIGDDIFYEVTANAYCHEYLGWNEDNMLDYGGDITWNVISASFVDGYDFEKDSYSFECYNVYFTAKKYFTTMYESGTGSALYELKKGSLASGVCVGMSYTTASIFNGYPSAADIVSSGIMRDIELNSKVTIGNNTIKLKDYIKYASIYQWSSEYWEDDDNTRGTDADTLLQLIKVMTDSDIMGMIVKFRQVELDENGEYYNTLWSHLVTVVGYSGNTLLIDDSNYRDELQTLTLHSNGTWEYSGNDEISEENCALSYHLDYYRPYQILLTGTGTYSDEVSQDSEEEEETYITGIERLDSDNLLLYLADAGNAVISGDTLLVEETSGNSSDEGEDAGALYWVLDATEILISNLDAEENTIWAAGDNTVIKLETGTVDSVALTIDEDSQIAKIASNEGDSCVVRVETISDDGDTTVSVEISGTVNGEVTAENIDNGLSIDGFSELTITLEVNNEETEVETFSDVDGVIEFTYDNTGGTGGNSTVSGTCGDNLTWVLTSDGTLTISGSGDMDSYDAEGEIAPWNTYRDEIISVIIDDGVASIGSCAFYDCGSLRNVMIADNVKSIGECAFYGCTSLEHIIFLGDAPLIGSYAFGRVTATAMYPASADGWEDVIDNYGGTLTWAAYTESTDFVWYAEVELDETEFTYSGAEITPAVTVTFEGKTLAEGTDYNVSYSDNVNVGYATVSIEGMGDYEGTITKSFTIEAQSLVSSNVSLSYTSKTYTGSAFSPSVTVTDASGNELTEDVDYKVTIPSGRKNAGTYTYTITGTGNYTGTVKKTLTIKPVSITVKSSAYVSCTLSTTSYTYSGSAKKPSVTLKVKVNGKTKTLSKSSSSGYTVSYKNNTKIGKATVTITGTGNYTGTITKTFKIYPKKGTISSLKSSAKKKMTVKWKTISGSVTKYQVRYRVKGTSKWTTKTYSSSTKSKTITGLKSGKTYQVQVRAYKTVSGNKYYGSWSSTKTVKVK